MNMGITSLFRRHGRMNLTNKINVLTALEKRALQYRKNGQVQLDTNEVLYKYAVDETGTVSTAYLGNPNAEFKEQYLYEKRRAEQHEMKEMRGVTDKVLKLHGIAPGKNREDMTRVI